MAKKTTNTSKLILQGEDRTKKSTKSAQAGFRGLVGSALRATTGIAALYAAIRATGAIVKGANALQNMENRMRLVVGAAGSVEKTQQRIFDIALRTRQPVGALAETYARLGLAADESGIPLQGLEQVVESIGQASALSGATAIESANAIRQFTQGFQSGRFAGEELRAVLEQLPRLAELIADGMGVSVGKLRELGKAGKLTTQQLYEAIQKGRQGISDEFATMDITIDQASTNLNTSLMRLLDAWVVNTGAADALAGAIDGVANAINALTENDLEKKRSKILADINKVKNSPELYYFQGSANKSLAQLREDLKKVNAEFAAAARIRNEEEQVADLKHRKRQDDKRKEDARAAKRARLGAARGANEPDTPEALKFSQYGENMRRKDEADERARAAAVLKVKTENWQAAMEAEREYLEGRDALLEELGVHPDSEYERLEIWRQQQQEHLDATYKIKADHEELTAALEAKYRQEKAILDEKAANEEREKKAKLYTDLIAFAGAFGKRGIKIARAITAVQKGEAFIQSLLAINTGASKALAQVPFPANLAAAASVLATGAGFIGAIKAVGGGGGGGSVSSSGSSFASTGSQSSFSSPPADDPVREKEVNVKIIGGGSVTLSAEGLESLIGDVAKHVGSDIDKLKFNLTTRPA